MRATPAETLLAPTPIFLIVVGYSSAVKTGITAFEELNENLASIVRAMASQFELSKKNGMGIVKRQAMPPRIIVSANGHRRPILRRIRMLTAMPGISTAPWIT